MMADNGGAADEFAGVTSARGASPAPTIAVQITRLAIYVITDL
jgi:hypothetical protein